MGGDYTRRFVAYISVLASVAALCALGNLGLALAGGNYNIEIAAWIIAVCLVVLFACALFRIVEDGKKK